MKPLTKDEKVEVLEGAAKLLDDPRQWTQGRFQRAGAGGTEAYCALGAIRKVVCDVRGEAVSSIDVHDETLNLGDEVGQMLARQGMTPVKGRGRGSVVEFNDRVGRTHDQVAKVLRSAACELKAKEEP